MGCVCCGTANTSDALFTQVDGPSGREPTDGGVLDVDAATGPTRSERRRVADALLDVCRKPQVRQGVARLHGIQPEEVNPAQFARTLAGRFNPQRRRAMSTDSARSLNRELETLCSASFYAYIDDKRVWPGQPARGVVVMDLESPLASGHTVVVELSGEVKASFTVPQTEALIAGDAWESVTTWVPQVDRRPLLHRSLVLHGTGDGELSPGVHRWPFVFDMPADAPASVHVVGVGSCAEVTREPAEGSVSVTYTVGAYFAAPGAAPGTDTAAGGGNEAADAPGVNAEDAASGAVPGSEAAEATTGAGVYYAVPAVLTVEQPPPAQTTGPSAAHSDLAVTNAPMRIAAPCLASCCFGPPVPSLSVSCALHGTDPANPHGPVTPIPSSEAEAEAQPAWPLWWGIQPCVTPGMQLEWDVSMDQTRGKAVHAWAATAVVRTRLVLWAGGYEWDGVAEHCRARVVHTGAQQPGQACPLSAHVGVTYDGTAGDLSSEVAELRAEAVLRVRALCAAGCTQSVATAEHAVRVSPVAAAPQGSTGGSYNDGRGGSFNDSAGGSESKLGQGESGLTGISVTVDSDMMASSFASAQLRHHSPAHAAPSDDSGAAAADGAQAPTPPAGLPASALVSEPTGSS